MSLNKTARTMPQTASPLPLMTGLGALLVGGGFLLARRKRKITLRWRGAAPDLSFVPGLADLQVRGDRATATLAGEVGPFVRAIASPALEDLTIEPASLEEAFLEFYADGEGPVAGAQESSVPKSTEMGP